MALLEFARPVAAYIEPGAARREPGFLTEAFGAAHGNLAPTARLGNHDEAANDLGVLARCRQPIAAICESAGAVGKVELVLDLHKALANFFRNAIRLDRLR